MARLPPGYVYTSMRPLGVMSMGWRGDGVNPMAMAWENRKPELRRKKGLLELPPRRSRCPATSSLPGCLSVRPSPNRGIKKDGKRRHGSQTTTESQAPSCKAGAAKARSAFWGEKHKYRRYPFPLPPHLRRSYGINYKLFVKPTRSELDEPEQRGKKWLMCEKINKSLFLSRFNVINHVVFH